VAVFTFIYYTLVGYPAPHMIALSHILTGGLFLGAFFMATDMVTSPITHKGMVMFGIGCGALTFLIRIWGGYPEGVSYSILLMNAVVPLIDRIIRPKVFGTKGLKA
jgi:electron transport complex protein RnfD